MTTKITLSFDSGRRVEQEVPVAGGKVSGADILRSLPYTERLTAMLEANPKAAADVVNAYASGKTDVAAGSARRAGFGDRETRADPDAVILQMLNHLIIARR